VELHNQTSKIKKSDAVNLSQALRQVEVGAEKILLIRRAGTITAINGTCPHAGAPLAEGVLHGGSVICPWHKAAFSAGSGKCLEPPAVDDVATYDLTIIDGDIFLAGERTAGPTPHAVRDDRIFIIIGAGAAGFSAAQELRAQKFGGRILLLDAGGALPYDRTILSKYTLAGTKGDEKTPLQDEEFYRREKIERRTATVHALDPVAQKITLADGEILTYDAALVATGGAARKLPFPGADLANIFTLRNQDDAANIVQAATHGQHAVIIGTGFIGMEAAAALRERGLQVTVIGQEAAPFEKQLGAEIGRFFQKIHEEQGVKFRLGAKIAALEGERAVSGVRLENGEILPADLVIAGLGVTPITEFVAGIARGEDGGLITGADLKIADHLYAAGDVALFPARGKGKAIRVEHWRVAQQQGRVAAQAMLGLDTVYDSVPVFWTIQYNKRLDYIGHASGKDQILIRGDLQAQNFIAYYLQDGIVKAAAGMNQDANMAAVLALMTAKQDWRIENLQPETATPQDVLNRREGRD
jgi:NADPH-dependent 2,4-dienoyl-CoA reductase/sulfur reductase-like enzyme/nitrite reductase/ring-hydroxylating ferredoxin subunit